MLVGIVAGQLYTISSLTPNLYIPPQGVLKFEDLVKVYWGSF